MSVNFYPISASEDATVLVDAPGEIADLIERDGVHVEVLDGAKKAATSVGRLRLKVSRDVFLKVKERVYKGIARIGDALFFVDRPPGEATCYLALAKAASSNHETVGRAIAKMIGANLPQSIEGNRPAPVKPSPARYNEAAAIAVIMAGLLDD